MMLDEIEVDEESLCDEIAQLAAILATLTSPIIAAEHLRQIARETEVQATGGDAIN